MPEVTADDVAAIRASMAPSPPSMIAEEVAKVMAVYPPPDKPAMHTAACQAVLREVPPDILRAGLLRVLAKCVFTPKPAEIWACMEAEFGERRRLAAKAGLAAARSQRRAARLTRRPTEAEIAQVSAQVAGLRVGGQDNPLKGGLDPRRDRTDMAAALRAVAAETAGRRLPDADDEAVRQILGAG